MVEGFKVKCLPIEAEVASSDHNDEDDSYVIDVVLLQEPILAEFKNSSFAIVLFFKQTFMLVKFNP